MDIKTTSDDDFSFWKNLSLVVLFFVVTPLVIATSLFSLSSFSKTQKPAVLAMQTPPKTSEALESGVSIYASLPAVLPAISAEVETADARSELIRQYLESYRSPLEPHSEIIVATADKYSLDYRLLTAIAQQESNLCKKIPANSFNCWGWGIHSRGTLGFTSFEEGIETVSRGLKEKYVDQGYESIEEIMGKYTPLSQGSWAFGVNYFMQDVEQ